MTAHQQFRHYAKPHVGSTGRSQGAKRQKFPVSGARFREARFSAGMGVPACADLLRVSERSIRGWESGSTRIPYAAFKLLRLLRGGKVLGPDWKGFHVWRGVLCTPEGHRFEPSDLVWQSLLVQQARAFREMARGRRSKAVDVGLVLSETSDKSGVEMALDRGVQIGPADPLQIPESPPVTLPGLRPARGPNGGRTGQRLGAAVRAAGGVA